MLTSALEREELLKWADKSLVDLPGMTHEIANKLKPAGIKTLDQLADLSTDELVEMTGIDHDKAACPDHKGSRKLELYKGGNIGIWQKPLLKI